MRPFDWDDGFPPSRPREAKGGIKAQSRRGAFAESWWARRWLAVLEGFSIGTRLHRGRAYARRGQVLGIAITEGRVEAQVQGSREKPYDVVLQVKTLGAGDWDKLGGVLAREARFAARLLAGAMPDDVEDAFRRAGLSLFPERRQDLRTSCSCPDWSNPCKHIAAVYYLLGEEFDRDPFLIFRLRGRERAALLAALGEAVPASVGEGLAASGEETLLRRRRGRRRPLVEAPAPAALPEPPAKLPVATLPFWNGGALRDDLFGEVERPAAGAARLRRLGRFPFWRGREPFPEALVPVYEAASRLGLDVFLGDTASPAVVEGTRRRTL